MSELLKWRYRYSRLLSLRSPDVTTVILYTRGARPAESQDAARRIPQNVLILAQNWFSFVGSCWISAYFSLKLNINANIYSRRPISKMLSGSRGRGFAPWPPEHGLCPWTAMGYISQTSVVTLHFSPRFVCGPSLQISCALLLCTKSRCKLSLDDASAS